VENLKMLVCALIDAGREVKVVPDHRRWFVFFTLGGVSEENPRFTLYEQFVVEFAADWIFLSTEHFGDADGERHLRWQEEDDVVFPETDSWKKLLRRIQSGL
jgi:hypothetical protein